MGFRFNFLPTFALISCDFNLIKFYCGTKQVIASNVKYVHALCTYDIIFIKKKILDNSQVKMCIQDKKKNQFPKLRIEPCHIKGYIPNMQQTDNIFFKF